MDLRSVTKIRLTSVKYSSSFRYFLVLRRYLFFVLLYYNIGEFTIISVVFSFFSIRYEKDGDRTLAGTLQSFAYFRHYPQPGFFHR